MRDAEMSDEDFLMFHKILVFAIIHLSKHDARDCCEEIGWLMRFKIVDMRTNF